MTARRLRLTSALILVPLTLMLVSRQLDADFGLSGRYYPNPSWQGEGVPRVDPILVTRSLSPVPSSVGGGPFSVRWDGYLHVDRPGRYVFHLTSDDGAWLEIDGRVVIDNGGHHSPLLKEATLDLGEGLHVIGLSFFQGAGGWRLELLWALEGEALRPLASPSLLNAPLDGWVHTIAATLRASLPFLPFLWLLALFILAASYVTPFFWRPPTSHHLGDRALHAVLLLSATLNACGIWWGLGWRWAPDEIHPSHVLEAIESRFSNGWSGPYPPFHYYILSLAYAPFLLADWLLEPRIAFPLHLLNRSVSLVMATGIVLVCYLIGRELRGRAAGLAAALLTSLLLPFVYYAKTGNLDVPYLFWFSLAILFYMRIVATGDAAAYTWFALVGALAIASKDQAFGFLVAPAVHAAWLRYQRLRHLTSATTIDIVGDPVVPRAALAGLAALVVAYNIPFNWEGFADHVRIIRINGSGKYRMVDMTFEGQFTLLKHTLSQVRFSYGWPALVFVCAGLASVARRPKGRSELWLLLPVVSYYLLFIAPTSIVFDRFVLGICLLLSIIAGCAVDAWMRVGGRARQMAIVCLAAVCAYSVLRAASLDALMVRDSRISIERWIASRLPYGTSVASVGPQSTLPRLEWMENIHLRSDDIAASIPYVVLNGTYAQRFDLSSAEGALYNRIRRGSEYSLLLEYRADRIWPLSSDPVFRDLAEDQFTNLDKVNPLIEVYKRNEHQPR